MPEIVGSAEGDASTAQRTEELFQEHQQLIFRRTDRLFAWLMLFQWIGGIFAALWISPLTWSGASSQIHIHVWAAIFLGGAITIFPIGLALLYPGQAVTRYTIGAAQMLMSGLLIHLTGGRIETHFHIFGSLAFLAFYRDWRVLIPATIVTGLDHYLRGIYWPQSIYGVLTASPWRSLEHVAWVVFEDIFLIAACVRSVTEMRAIASHTAQLEITNKIIEDKVVQRTAEVVESEERFRLLMDGVPDYAIFMLDAAGRVASWNEGAKGIHGYQASEIIGRHFSLFHSEEDRRQGKPEAELQAAVATGRLEDEGWRLRKDGTCFWANVVLTALYDEAGELRGFSNVTRDVTQRKQVDEELRAAKVAAEEASLAKSQFLANMSHEIRTPMNGVLGPIGLLLDSKLSSQQRDLTEIARSSAESLLGIINDILDLSKIEVGKLDIEPIPFNLLWAVEETASMMASRAEEKGIDLIVRCPPTVPHHVIGDPGRIRQVLANLVSNAIKFTAHGHVLINIENEAQTADEVTLCFTVEDSGIGIAADKIEHVFGRFNQADTSTTRRYGGTGLGLSISRQLVELMDGEIGAESTLDEGSTFWFRLRLPLQKEETVPGGQSAVAVPEVDLTDVRVLIVDDNAVNRRVLHEQLNNWRLHNTSCASAVEALETMRAAHEAGEPFHIAILDHQMPDIDGEMLGTAIKADTQLRDTVLVMLTSLGHKGDANRLKEVGFAAYLLKPARQSELLGALMNVWAAHIAQAPAEMVTRHSMAHRHASPAAQRWGGTRVLVVEDNIVNQKVAVMILESFGCRVEVAANGREGLHSIDTLPFDIVFMDCEMPEMDGYAATAEIRRRTDAKRTLPVIAVTAKATKGDRERCLEVGMDDYMSKPVRQEDFQTMLERWVGGSKGEDTATQETAAPEANSAAGSEVEEPAHKPALDTEVVARLRSLAEATEASLLDNIFEAFLSDGEARLATLRAAVEQRDAETMRKAAHALKGASANVGALCMAEISQELQALGEAGTVEGATEWIDQLEAEFARAKLEIAAALEASS